MKVCRSPGASAALLLSQSPGAGSAPEAVPVQGVETCPRPTAHGAQGRRALAVMWCGKRCGHSGSFVRARPGNVYALLQPCCRGGCGVRAGCGRCCIMQAWSTQALRDAQKRPSFSFSAFFRPTVSASATCLRGGKPHGSPPQRVQPARSAPWTCGEPRKHIFAASSSGCKLGLSCDRKQQRFGLHRPGSKTENERP